METIKTVRVLVVLLLLFIVACTPPIDVKEQCAADNDCVAAQCCHATAAVNRDFAPNCHGLLCTQDCVSGSADCGGKIQCQHGRCVVSHETS